MISRMLRIVPMIVLATFALSSAAWATCSNASLSGAYGFLSGGTDSQGTLTTIVLQLTFDSTAGTFTGTGTQSQDGVITTGSIKGTYAVASNCTGTGTVTAHGKTNPISFVVTSGGTGLREVDGKTGATTGGFAVAKGSPTCTNAGVKGSFGFQTTGVFLAGAPATGPVAFIGELTLSVNASGDGVIDGKIAGSEDGTIFTFKEEPVTGSYSVNTNCLGKATITPTGHSPLNFSFVVVDGGKEMLAIETDVDTVVSGILQQ
jgi:hypothetical protein